MGNRHSSRQDVLLLTETGDIADGKLEAEESYVASPESIEAWELDYNQQCKDVKTGRMCQVISERHKKPLKIFEGRSVLEGSSTDVIASRKQDEELAYMNSGKEKNKMVLWVGIIAAMLAVVISIVVLVQLKRSHEAQPATQVIPIYAAVSIGAKNKRPRLREVLEAKDLDKIYDYDSTETVLCIVIVEKTGEKTYPRIAKSLIPPGSLERKYRGNPCHLLGLNNEGKLWAIEPPNTIEAGDSPKDCFIALQYEQEVNAVFGMSEGTLEKIKIGLFIGLCIAELIVLFLIITAVGGS